MIGIMKDKIYEDKEGFTLLEILIAIVILTLGILGYIAIQSGSINSRVFAREMTRAMTAGVSDVERLLIRDFDKLTESEIEYRFKDTWQEATLEDYQNGKAYMIERSVTGWDPVMSNPNAQLRTLRTIIVTTRWKQKGDEHSITEITFERGHKTGDTK